MALNLTLLRRFINYSDKIKPRSVLESSEAKHLKTQYEIFVADAKEAKILSPLHTQGIEMVTTECPHMK